MHPFPSPESYLAAVETNTSHPRTPLFRQVVHHILKTSLKSAHIFTRVTRENSEQKQKLLLAASLLTSRITVSAMVGLVPLEVNVAIMDVFFRSTTTYSMMRLDAGSSNSDDARRRCSRHNAFHAALRAILRISIESLTHKIERNDGMESICEAVLDVCREVRIAEFEVAFEEELLAEEKEEDYALEAGDVSGKGTCKTEIDSRLVARDDLDEIRRRRYDEVKALWGTCFSLRDVVTSSDPRLQDLNMEELLDFKNCFLEMKAAGETICSSCRFDSMYEVSLTLILILV